MYCIFDLLTKKRIEKGMSEQEMFSYFRHQKIKKKQLLFFTKNCSLEAAKLYQKAFEDFLEMSWLEICLRLGYLPLEYQASFEKLIPEMLGKLEKTKCLQPLEHTPVFCTDWGELFQADCLDWLRSVPDESVDLVFADPPFNIGKEYGQDIDDSKSCSDYLDWSKSWMSECIRVLKPGGSFLIYNIPKWCAAYADYLDKRLTFRSWIAVNRNYAPVAYRLNPTHYGLLYYVKGMVPKTFHEEYTTIQTCRHCGGEIRDYGGYRKTLNPNGICLGEIWTDITPVKHRSRKNREYNELSVKMLDRIICMTTDPGDTVLDPFGGSGTTFAAAELLNRKWIGCEIGDCSCIVERFTDIQKDREALAKVYQNKNRLFSDEVAELRKRNGFWTNLDDPKNRVKKEKCLQYSFSDLLNK